MSVMRADGNIAFTSAIRIQYTNDLTDVFKDYTNPDGTAVEFRILEPTLSVLNLPMPIEAQYVKFKIQDYVGAPCLKVEIMGCARLDCMDINECSENNGGCEQKCLNTLVFFNSLNKEVHFFFLMYSRNLTELLFFLDQEISHAPATSATSFIPPTVQRDLRLKSQNLVNEMETHTKGISRAYQSCAHHLDPQKTENCYLRRILTTLEILFSSNVISDL